MTRERMSVDEAVAFFERSPAIREVTSHTQGDIHTLLTSGVSPGLSETMLNGGWLLSTVRRGEKGLHAGWKLDGAMGKAFLRSTDSDGEED